MDFPRLNPVRCDPVPPGLAEALGAEPVEVHQTKTKYFAVFGAEDSVRNLRPDMAKLEGFHPRGVAATAPGDAGTSFRASSRPATASPRTR